MKFKKIITTMLLASSIITSSAYSWSWSQPEPQPWHQKAVDTAKNAIIKGGGYVAGGIGSTVEVVGRAGEVFFRKWKKFDKTWPTVASIIAGGFFATYFRTPINNLLKKPIEKIPFPKWLKDLFKEDNDLEKASFYVTTKPKKTLKDLAEGELPREVAMLVEKRKLGIDLEPILFHGPSGTGKSLIAEVFAHEIGRVTGKRVALLSSSGAAFLSKYVGESPKKVQELLEDAEGMVKRQDKIIMKVYHLIRAKSHVVIFIDEMLSLASGTKGDSQYGWATVEALQCAINKYFPNPHIDLIATTNSTDIPDALIERFDCIYFPAVSTEKKLNILEFYLDKQSEEHLKTPYVNIDDKLTESLKRTLESYANLTTPRDMFKVAKHAAFLAKDAGNADIEPINILEALDWVLNNKKTRARSKDYGKEKKQNQYEQLTQQMKEQKQNTQKQNKNENLISGVLKDPNAAKKFPTKKGYTLGEKNTNDNLQLTNDQLAILRRNRFIRQGNRKKNTFLKQKNKRKNKFLRHQLENQLKRQNGKLEKIKQNIKELESTITKNETEQNRTYMNKFKKFACKVPLVSKFYKDKIEEENVKHKSRTAKLNKAREQLEKQNKDIQKRNNKLDFKNFSLDLEKHNNFNKLKKKKTKKRSDSFEFKKKQRKKQSQLIDALTL